MVLAPDERLTVGRLAVIGGSCGLALYNNILIFPVVLFCAWRIASAVPRDKLLIWGVTLLVGYAPMLLFNVDNGFISYKILAGKFLNVGSQQVAEQGLVASVVQGLADKASGGDLSRDYLLLFVFPHFFLDGGGYYLQTIAFIAMAALGLLGAASLYRGRFKNALKIQPKTEGAMFICIGLCLLISLSQARYITLLVPLIPIVIGQGIVRCWALNARGAMVVLALLVVYAISGHWNVLSEDAPAKKDEYAVLYKYLEDWGFTHGYGGYELQAYSAFRSGGRIKISPQMGPNFMDKIPAYSQIVDRTEDVFFIMGRDSVYLDYLDQNEISYKVDQADLWWVVWDLSKRVYPKELLLHAQVDLPVGYHRWNYKENPAVLELYRGGH